jgi:hypothetical protein
MNKYFFALALLIYSLVSSENAWGEGCNRKSPNQTYAIECQFSKDTESEFSNLVFSDYQMSGEFNSPDFELINDEGLVWPSIFKGHVRAEKLDYGIFYFGEVDDLTIEAVKLPSPLNWVPKFISENFNVEEISSAEPCGQGAMECFIHSFTIRLDDLSCEDGSLNDLISLRFKTTGLTNRSNTKVYNFDGLVAIVSYEQNIPKAINLFSKDTGNDEDNIWLTMIRFKNTQGMQSILDSLYRQNIVKSDLIPEQ